jgi:hypothetical protein
MVPALFCYLSYPPKIPSLSFQQPSRHTAISLCKNMITGELKSQIDRIWDAFWSGGISNPLEVIEQITYLLFIKRLDELHTAQEKKANRLGKSIEKGPTIVLFALD